MSKSEADKATDAITSMGRERDAAAAAPVPPGETVTPEDELEGILGSRSKHECAGWDCSMCEEFDNGLRDLVSRLASRRAASGGDDTKVLFAGCPECNDDGVTHTHEGIIIGPCEKCSGMGWWEAEARRILAAVTLEGADVVQRVTKRVLDARPKDREKPPASGGAGERGEDTYKLIADAYLRLGSLDDFENALRDAERWRASVREWKRLKLRPTEIGLDSGNDCFDTFEEAVDSLRTASPTEAPEARSLSDAAEYAGCHAGKDGDCIWPKCPQLVNRQSHCPLDNRSEETL